MRKAITTWPVVAVKISIGFLDSQNSTRKCVKLNKHYKVVAQSFYFSRTNLVKN